METLFDKIIKRQVPADIVFEDELCLAFRDISPQAPTHILLIPKKPIESMAKLNTEDQALMGHMLLTAAQIAQSEGLSEEGYRLVVNTNSAGGQSVYHLHMHILGGRQMQWPPG